MAPSENSDTAATVLVVDDNPVSRKLLRTYLESDGHPTLEVEDGEHAVDCVREHHPAVVVLDVMLPGISGFDVCERIKGDPATAGTRVVVVTTLENRYARTRALEARADDFLIKPVKREELLDRVRAALAGGPRAAD